MRNLQTVSKREIEARREAIRKEREQNFKTQTQAYAKVHGISLKRAEAVFSGLIKPKS